MNWQEEYRRKTVSPEEAVKLVKSGDRVVFGRGRDPLALGLALAARKDELRGVTVFLPTPGRDFGWYDPGWEQSFAIEVYMPLPVVMDMIAERRCDLDVSPRVFFGSPSDPEERIDVLLVELSPPDQHGFCSFGAAIWEKKEQIQRAKLVLAEVNDRLIRTYGENFVHVSEIDYFVEHTPTGDVPASHDLLGRATRGPEEHVKAIAEYVSSLIKDGDTIQIGIGTTSEPIVLLGAFDNKHDLGWHSEATPRGIIRLVREGVFTGKYKTVHRGKVVATSIGGGTKEDMDFVNENPIFELYPACHTHDIRVIAAHDNMVAINNALSVDLTGQIAAESIGHRVFSSAGGQPAFAIGAALSKGGRFITVLPSTAAGGTVSRIVPVLEPGTIVSVNRTFADIVVTEYGIARLRERTQRQRAQELIAIAHPEFRSELKKEAERLFWP